MPSIAPLNKSIDIQNKPTGQLDAYHAATQQDSGKESFLIKSTSDPVAFFTAVLAVATIGLWIFTALMWLATKRAVDDAATNSDAQARDMSDSIAQAARAASAMERVAVETHEANRIARDTTEKSIVATLRAAEASERSAALAEKVLNQLEGPIIRPHRLAFRTDPFARVEFAFRNFGRSAARVTNVSASIYITLANNPTAMRHSFDQTFMFDELISEKEKSEVLFITNDFLSQEQERVGSAISDLHIVINFSWKSLIGHSATEGQRFIWSPARQRFLSGTQLWDDPARFPPGQTRRP